MYKIYQVEYGDTIDIIANKTNTTRENIKRINGIDNDSQLMVGNLIIVPNEEKTIFETYKVKSGDSIYSIARMYNIAPEVLLSLNGLNKSDYIYPNQEILVPNQNVMIYVTQDGDTLETLTNNFGVDLNTLNKENERVLVLPDQLVVHKKESNN